jgi:nitroreductase
LVNFHDRVADYPIDLTFLERWSPRAFTGEVISQNDLMTMLEAARWAASSYNSQPWRFVYARRDTAQFDPFLSLLTDSNKAWAKDASALVVMVSNSLMRPPGTDKDVPSHTHSFDAGAASGYFALQANKMGWYVHGMIGFDMQRAFTELCVPSGHRIEAVFAVGRRADKSKLPEMLRAREQPNQRRPLKELAFEGAFPASP